MRLAALTLVAALGTAVAAMSANAAPVAPNRHDEAVSNIVQVRGGCGWGFHRTHHGFCAPDRYSYVRPNCGWGFHFNHRGICVPNGPVYYGGGYYRPHRYWYGY